METPDRDIEELLRRSRPEPGAAWVRETEQRLLPVRAPSLWRRPVVRAGSALAAGLAALAIVFSLAGVGPLAGGDDAVKARPTCRDAETVAPRREPYIAFDRQGRPHIRYRRKTGDSGLSACARR